MKKRALVAAVYLLLSAMIVTAVAAGGDSSDPLVSLSYLNGTFASRVDSAVNARLDSSDAALKASRTSGAAASSSAAWTESRLKRGDVITGECGASILLLAGGMKVVFSSGAVIDASAGVSVSSGASLSACHRYLVAEDTSAVFTVSSKTAVTDYQGGTYLTLSGNTDYNAMAAALKAMNLFRGSYTGYGSGYDLELAPTRLQALIMFTRVLGEENAALAYTGSTHFTDVAAGSDAAKYVGYACSRGYSNGFSKTLFKPSQTVTASQYVEFMLRALGYSSTANTDLSDTMARAQAAGVLTAGETSMLNASQFLRADLVYVSYYSLDAAVSNGGGTLRDTLISKGVFTAAEASAASALVTGPRIS